MAKVTDLHHVRRYVGEVLKPDHGFGQQFTTKT